MRVATDNGHLDVHPGSTADVVVDIVNTGAVIDGVSAHVIGLPDHFVTAQPAMLPLFPDTSGRVTLSLAVPPTLRAGRHPLTVEVVSHGARLPSQYLDVDLDVAPRPALALVAQPRTIRARRGARFVLALTNEGNVALDVTITAVDADRAVRTELVPSEVRLEAGATAPVLLTVRGPRMITGGELDRTVTVAASANAITPAHDAADTEVQELGDARETTVRLRQRPLLSRGLLTALILACIVALWAGVFLLGLTKVFSGDPMTKQAPASFFLPKSAGTQGGSGGASGTGSSAAAAPVDALPKSGQLPPGTGGALSGTVLSENAHQPVGRILVQAWRIGLHGPELVSSAASQSDGTYALGGLFPTSYYLKFSASGYKTVWYPGSPTRTGAKQVAAVAQATTTARAVVITGRPASISGTVSPGDTLQRVTTTVVARPLLGASADLVAATAKTAADGSYHLTGLAAPGSYQLTFTTPGYQASTLVDQVGGGDQRLEPTITLGASPGQIGGTVTDGSVALGGALVTTTVNGAPLTVTTPTTGQVGAYLLGNLPTPGTYVVTYSAPGHGSFTKVIDLTAGQTRTVTDIVLTNGTGTVTGRLVDDNGNGLGGATVTVGGATTTGGSAPTDGVSGSTAAPTTTTLTSGVVGSFAISGLAAPGAYTLTFTLDGYAPASVPVSLKDNGKPPSVTVTLSTQLGGITGTVREVRRTGGTTVVLADPFVGATVTATNGQQVWTATSSATGGALPKGGYLITGLQPGTYSVTVSADGLQQQTGIATVLAGTPQRLNLTLTKAG